MGWAESWDDSWAPGVFANRVLDRRHMIHVVRRWMADHTPEIQLAWMNGTGMVVWENIFGSWNGWRDRDAVQWNLASRVLRRWSRHFSEGVWTPLACMPAPGVFASSWELGGVRLWTLVNRNSQAVSGIRLPVNTVTACDPVAGRQLVVNDRQVAIGIPAAGLGAVVEEAVDREFLDGQADRYRQLDHARHEQPRLVPKAPNAFRESRAPAQAPDGMVGVTGGLLTCGAPNSGCVSAACTKSARAGESRGPGSPRAPFHGVPGVPGGSCLQFAIDRHSVTVAAYRRFVEETGYSPEAPGCFLEPGAGPHEPVTRVDPDDARAYASWLGRRLPTEAEWQRAAEDGLLGDDPVRVWNWTEPEMSDGRTRFCIVKGGSHHHSSTSDWYADGGVRDAAFAAKYLLMWPGLDRCATIGFRTAVDLRVSIQSG